MTPREKLAPLLSSTSLLAEGPQEFVETTFQPNNQKLNHLLCSTGTNVRRIKHQEVLFCDRFSR